METGAIPKERSIRTITKRKLSSISNANSEPTAEPQDKKPRRSILKTAVKVEQKKEQTVDSSVRLKQQSKKESKTIASRKQKVTKSSSKTSTSLNTQSSNTKFHNSTLKTSGQKDETVTTIDKKKQGSVKPLIRVKDEGETKKDNEFKEKSDLEEKHNTENHSEERIDSNCSLDLSIPSLGFSLVDTIIEESESLSKSVIQNGSTLLDHHDTDNERPSHADSSEPIKVEEDVTAGVVVPANYSPITDLDISKYRNHGVLNGKTFSPEQQNSMSNYTTVDLGKSRVKSLVEKDLNAMKTPESVCRNVMRSTAPTLINSSRSTPRKVRKSTLTDFRRTRNWGTPETHCYLRCQRSSPSRLLVRDAGNKKFIRKKKIKIIPAAFINPATKKIFGKTKNLPMKTEALEKTIHSPPVVKDLVKRFEFLIKQCSPSDSKVTFKENIDFKKNLPSCKIRVSPMAGSTDTNITHGKSLKTKILENKENFNYKTTDEPLRTTDNQIFWKKLIPFYNHNALNLVGVKDEAAKSNRNRFSAVGNDMDVINSTLFEDEYCLSRLFTPTTQVEETDSIESGTLPSDDTQSEYNHYDLLKKHPIEVNAEHDAETTDRKYLSFFSIPELKKKEVWHETEEVLPYAQGSELNAASEVVDSCNNERTDEMKHYFIKVYECDVSEESFSSCNGNQSLYETCVGDPFFQTPGKRSFPNEINEETKENSEPETNEFVLQEEEFPPLLSPQKNSEFID